MCNCSKCTYCLGNVAYICERLASCCAATSVVTCIVTTLLIMLALGIGLGYNYCYVDLETGRSKEENNPMQTLLPVDVFRTTTQRVTTTSNSSKSLRKGPKNKSHKIDATQSTTKTTPSPIKIESTMIVPLFLGIDFSLLIQKIQERNQNCTLHLIV